MELYDVGMSSMVAMELEALANLSITAFDPPRTKDHALLTSRLAELSGLISTHLWDDTNGIFTNKFSGNGSFYRRISPTSFYPMQAGIATEEQATAMATSWLMNASRFCVSPTGDFKGNSAGCWWGLPSISADDPSYPKSGYWRGHVWGPMPVTMLLLLRSLLFVCLFVVLLVSFWLLFCFGPASLLSPRFPTGTFMLTCA